MEADISGARRRVGMFLLSPDQSSHSLSRTVGGVAAWQVLARRGGDDNQGTDNAAQAIAGPEQGNFHRCDIAEISNKCIAVRKVATPLRELTCHMGSHSVTCHPAEVTFPPLPQPKLVLDSATPEGCKAELTYNRNTLCWQASDHADIDIFL